MHIRKCWYKRLGWLRSIRRSHVDLHRSGIVDATGRSQNEPFGNYRTTTIVDRTVRVGDFKASMPREAVKRVDLPIDDTGFKLMWGENVLKSDIIEYFFRFGDIALSTPETLNIANRIERLFRNFIPFNNPNFLNWKLTHTFSISYALPHQTSWTIAVVHLFTCWRGDTSPASP